MCQPSKKLLIMPSHIFHVPAKRSTYSYSKLDSYIEK